MKHPACLFQIIVFVLYSYNNIIGASSSDPDNPYAPTYNEVMQNRQEFPVTGILQAQSDSQGNTQSDTKSVSVIVSYNPDNSDYVSTDLLENIQREISTTFIGSGYRYSTEENSDISVKAYLDLDVSSYDQQDKNIYDIVSKIDLKSYDQHNKLLKETTQSIFLSGDQINDVILDATRRSSSTAARDLVDELKTIYGNKQPEDANVVSLKIEIIFRGPNNYKYFNDLNKLLVVSPYNLRLIKRTFEPGNFFSVIVLSRVESDILASYIQRNLEGSGSLQLSDLQQNRLVFYILPGVN